MELYLQLTEKCNMSCAHCCMNATSRGRVMSDAVFAKAMEIIKEFGGSVTLGGGEPTLHPKVIEWAMEAAVATLDMSMDMGGPATLVVTNGKKTEVAIKLAKLGHLGVIQADLSQDKWHDEIDERVVAEFTRYNKHGWEKKKGYAGIRNVEGGVKGQGRAAENGLQDMEGCACSAMFIDPSGDFFKCGCKITKLGNILVDEIPQVCFDFVGECEKDMEAEILAHEHEIVEVNDPVVA